MLSTSSLHTCIILYGSTLQAFSLSSLVLRLRHVPAVVLAPPLSCLLSRLCCVLGFVFSVFRCVLYFCSYFCLGVWLVV